MIITDRLKSYGAAKAEVLPSVELCQDRGQNNRAENSHQPTRDDELTVQVIRPRAVFSLGPRNSFPHTSEWEGSCIRPAVTKK